jgi:hypothetical protein
VRAVVGQRRCGGRRLELRVRLFELDFIGTRVVLVHDLAVLEMDLGQVTTDLGAQYNRNTAIDRRVTIESGRMRRLPFSAFLQNNRHAAAVSWTTCAFFRRLMYG